MTTPPTIRAHVPVETPAGLVVALPPCDGSYGCPTAVHVEGCYQTTAAAPTGLTSANVFALAVPCPTQDPLDGRQRNCRKCNGTGWVHQGDYRVLDVLPIEDGDRVSPPDYYSTTGYIIRSARSDLPGMREHWAEGPIDLPGAVPGGVALIVEEA
jgi:hypothetical protein